MKLTDAERMIVAGCIREAADGSLYDEWEFATIFGLKREDMRAAAEDWRHNQAGASMMAAINALNNLLGYPHSNETRAAVFAALGTNTDAAKRLLDRLVDAGRVAT